MQLREDLALGTNFHLLTQANWIKLRIAFGGGPEIPFFSYQRDVETELPDGRKETNKETCHDF